MRILAGTVVLALSIPGSAGADIADDLFHPTPEDHGMWAAGSALAHPCGGYANALGKDQRLLDAIARIRVRECFQGYYRIERFTIAIDDRLVGAPGEVRMRLGSVRSNVTGLSNGSTYADVRLSVVDPFDQITVGEARCSRSGCVGRTVDDGIVWSNVYEELPSTIEMWLWTGAGGSGTGALRLRVRADVTIDVEPLARIPSV